MTRTALIIGGTGFLGRGIAHELNEAGWNVSILARGQMNTDVPGATFIAGDRQRAHGLHETLGNRSFDLVVDCIVFNRAEADDAIAALAGRCGHYVMISTDFVYANADATSACFPLTEDAAKLTDLPYATGKLEAEQALLNAAAANEFPATVLRPAHLIGRGRLPGTNTPLAGQPQLFTALRSGAPVVVFGEGLLLTQPSPIREVGRCCAHIAGDRRVFGQMYNCVGPNAVTTRHYLELLADLLGGALNMQSLPVTELFTREPARTAFVRHRIYDQSRLITTTSYQPSVSLRDALGDAVAWAIEQGH